MNELPHYERNQGIRGSFIVVQPQFPIHYVDTLAPAGPAAVMPSGSAITPSAAAAVTLSLYLDSPHFRPRIHRTAGSSKGETDNRFWSESSSSGQGISSGRRDQ